MRVRRTAQIHDVLLRSPGHAGILVVAHVKCELVQVRSGSERVRSTRRRAAAAESYTLPLLGALPLLVHHSLLVGLQLRGLRRRPRRQL